MNPLKFLDGWKTYLTAAGLVGLAIYQISQGEYVQGAQTLLAALAAASVRHAITKGA